MADVPLTTALIILAQERRGDVVRQINRRSTLSRVLPVRPGGGANVAWVLEADGQAAEKGYAEGADAVDFASDAQSSAILNWGLYRATMKVTGTALRTARTAVQPQGNKSLWRRQQENAVRKIVSSVNQDFFAGPGTGTRMAGLDVAIGSVSNTYATVDRSQVANAFFRPYVKDPGALTPLSFAQIRDDRTQIYNQCGEKPDIAIVSPSVLDTIATLFDAPRRYVYDITTARGAVKLDAGYGGIEFDGMVFLEDKDATSNWIYYLNTTYVHVEYLPPDQDTVAPDGAMMDANDGFGPTPLGILYEGLAKTGDSKKAQALANLALAVERPNACGVRKNIALVA